MITKQKNVNAFEESLGCMVEVVDCHAHVHGGNSYVVGGGRSLMHYYI